MPTIGVLLTNTGTPDAPTPPAVRRYLREFLSDRRIVQIPRLIWLPILYGLILPARSRRSAELYQSIWTSAGSPLRTYMESIQTKLQAACREENIVVAVGMNYGNPSIKKSIQTLSEMGAEHLMILPLFPQYSHTTTASSYDRITRSLKKRTQLPMTAIQFYGSNPNYIDALKTTIAQHWQLQGKPQQLLISFHGIPERFVAAGDPYAEQCHQTAQLLAEALQLKPNQWQICFQSQFGYDKWLKPSTQTLLTALPKQGITHIDVICPGFPVDCLETLEEINMRGKESFLEAGGEQFHYIPALNDSPLHIEMLASIIKEQIVS